MSATSLIWTARTWSSDFSYIIGSAPCRESPAGGFFVPSPPGPAPFCPLTRARCLLPVPGSISFGVMPPAGDFSCQRKVTKSWLRTKVLRIPLHLLWVVCTVLPLAFPADGCKGVGVPLLPRFGALPWRLLKPLQFPDTDELTNAAGTHLRKKTVDEGMESTQKVSVLKARRRSRGSPEQASLGQSHRQRASLITRFR